MSAEPPLLVLVVSTDAGLRERCFERLLAAGHRVDAVGDQRAVERRLAKDPYDVIVASGDCPLPADIRAPVVSASTVDLAPGVLEESVRNAVAAPPPAG